MSKEQAMNHEQTTETVSGLEPLSEDEAKQVSGAGLLSSPLGVHRTQRGVWVREVTEDAWAY